MNHSVLKVHPFEETLDGKQRDHSGKLTNYNMQTRSFECVLRQTKTAPSKAIIGNTIKIPIR